MKPKPARVVSAPSPVDAQLKQAESTAQSMIAVANVHGENAVAAQIEQDELGLWAENIEPFRELLGTWTILPEGDENNGESPAVVKAVTLVAEKLGTEGVGSCVAVGCRAAGAAFLAHISCVESLEAFAPAIFAFLEKTGETREWYLYNGLVFDEVLVPAVQDFLKRRCAAGPFRYNAVDAGCGSFAFDVRTGEPHPPRGGGWTPQKRPSWPI